MINVCKITDISRTNCILRSVPSHFLQLLRDNALWGRTCGRHSPTLNILFHPPLFFGLNFPVSPPWSAEMVRSLAGDPSLQHPPPSPRPVDHETYSLLLQPICRYVLLSSLEKSQLRKRKHLPRIVYRFSLERDARGASLVGVQWVWQLSLTTQSSHRPHRLAERIHGSVYCIQTTPKNKRAAFTSFSSKNIVNEKLIQGNI